ncbi:ThuA domain-containing protein [Parapedobacter sp. ISTM3]|uniref:PVC-type heme-binding CxxCH protein n=1 Tax=Parapedobacter sp. ISTM3 TaxID=2800130 RepID=UPI0019055D16|nr:PVC-type heme-binding CxxCH protein [Parapedobacter sp. ISTM3]MBK1438712.1 ThuA domain-containing protein [Parapedobacter sp. ISTM3]
MNKLIRIGLLLLTPLFFLNCGGQKNKDDGPRRLELFFLGHASKHHDSELLADILAQAYFPEGINITYSVDPDDLTREDLYRYDGLIVYANHDSISPAQEKALLDYVASGKGFIPLHSASFCFRNSPEVVALIGGQFKSHGGGAFSAEIVMPDHPAVEGVEPFETEWDETYVHDKIADDIVVLMERVDSTHREPYTWVKEYGNGRVFYTAFGHDERTFRNPGFLQLVRSGIRWAVGEEAVKKMEEYTIAQPTYEAGRMPNYERRDPPPRYQHPLSPEESQTLIQVPVGFRLELFASEPDIKKPIAMDWDEKGRLWVIETVDYPNTVRNDKGQGDDRITICEDTDGDGKADKFTVFAEGLNIPTAFTFVNGGIVVAQAPHFLFLKDTDGDGKADVREVLIDGWGTYDTHAGPSNLRYGMDNKIWGTVGYSGFEGTIGGQPFKFGAGVYQFDGEAKQFEYLGNTSNNTWGLGFSEEFDVFISTANNEHSDFFAIPARYYEKANLHERGIEKIDAHYNMHVLTKDLRQVDVHGGFTAAAGHSLYTARAFPQEYWNRVAFISEPTGRLVHRHILEQVGAGFKEKGDGWNMIASADNWFGPVEAKVGPDGALWVLDWYNFIIQHNPTPEGFETGEGNAYIDPLRDNTKGRIYRLVHEDAKRYKPLKLNPERTSTLVNGLKSDNMFWRLTAQRLLVESGGKEAAGDLHKLIRDRSVDEVAVNGAATHAIWALHGLGLLDGSDESSISVVIEALKHPAPGVRRAAIQTLPATEPDVVQQLLASGVTQDPDLRVRLAAFLALSDAAPTAEIGSAVFEAAQQPENIGDKWVSHALLIAGTVHRQAFMDEYHQKLGHPDLSNTDGSLGERIVAGKRMTVLPLTTERGGTIGGRQIPDFVNQEISFVADVLPGEMRRVLLEGVLISHGDNRDGYAVFLKDGKIYFQVNQKGRKAIIHSADSLPGQFKVKASLLAGGKMTLTVDDKQVAEGKATGLFAEMPGGFIRIGHNRQRRWGDDSPRIANVGDYPDDFHFTGRLENTRLVIVNTHDVGEGEAVAADESITIKAVIGEMKYDVTNFTAKAGQTLKIIFENPDHMQHNLLVLKPGTLDRVGQAADDLAKQPNGVELQYIPNTPDVLFSTPLVNPEERYELTFTVPTTPGDYPYVCTFPGHWRIMQGVMRVTR